MGAQFKSRERKERIRRKTTEIKGELRNQSTTVKKNYVEVRILIVIIRDKTGKARERYV